MAGPPSSFMVKVDLGDIAEKAMARLPSRDDQNRMVQGLGAAAMAYWKKQAQQTLRSSSREYIQALTSESEDRKFTITLGGETALPNMIELGFAGGNMRDWMLDGPKVKRGKKGKYLTIPFQHGSKDTGGRNVGPEMPASIYQAAKKLAATVSRPTRGGGHAKTVKYGGRLTENSAHLNAHARKLLTTKQKPHHHSSIYRGMIREEKTFKKKTQTTGYFTFRTLSENSTTGWMHPGIPAARLAQKTQRHIRKIARHMLVHATTGKQ